MRISSYCLHKERQCTLSLPFLPAAYVVFVSFWGLSRLPGERSVLSLRREKHLRRKDEVLSASLSVRHSGLISFCSIQKGPLSRQGVQLVSDLLLRRARNRENPSVFHKTRSSGRLFRSFSFRVSRVTFVTILLGRQSTRERSKKEERRKGGKEHGSGRRYLMC